jgi:microcystin-dependent protein
MTIEAATYVNDLQPVNPPSTDPVSQGDDHLRLLKQVLQNTFVGASRQWQIPGTAAISATGPITKANGESTVYVSTAGGAVTLTLPTLVALDAGWRVRFVKTSSDVNPIFIAPPSGTLNSGGVAGLSKARRCIPGVACEAIWDGTNWFVTRALALPIGSLIEYSGSALPAGYEWPSGQTLSSAANYPEYNSAMGGLVTIDKRGRVGIPLDNLGGGAAGRLPGGQISGSTFGATGGTDTITLSLAQMPNHRHGVVFNDAGHTHGIYTLFGGIANAGTVVSGTQSYVNSTGLTAPSGTNSVAVGNVSDGSGNVNVTTFQGSSNSHGNLQPSIMVSQILVVE